MLRSAGASAGRALRDLLAGDGVVVAPGCYDALSARLIAHAGFRAAYLSGYGVSASLLAVPDVGVVTQTEMVDAVRRAAAAAGDIPLIADADTGYGGPANVARTVQLYEQAGAAAVQIEDQESPKRCGHLPGKQVVEREEAVDRVRLAAAARSDPATVLVARTDAAAIHGVEEAIARALAFSDAGADVLFVEAPPDRRAVEHVAQRLAGTALLFNWVDGGRSPALTLADLAALGFRVVIFPVTALFAATGAVLGRLHQLGSDGVPRAEPPVATTIDFGGFGQLLDIDTYLSER